MGTCDIITNAPPSHLKAPDYLVLFTIVGYPLIAGVSGELGMQESPILSILVRIITAALGIYCLFKGASRSIRPIQFYALCAFATFWCAYILRVIHYAVINSNILPWSGIEYISYSIIFCLLPAAGATKAELTNSKRLLWVIFSTAGLAILINLHQSMEALTDLASIAESRAKSDKLNPISLGMLAGNALLICTYLYRERLATRWSQHLAALFLAILAVIALVLSASKGPTIALVASLLVLFSFPLSIERIVRVSIGSLVTGAATALLFIYLSAHFDIKIVDRFLDLASGQSSDQSNIERLLAFRSAWGLILDSPIIGSSLVDHELFFYPHNLFLEVLLSTGVLGFLLFVFFSAVSLTAGYRALQTRASSSWLVILLIQYLIGAMVSGGIHMSSQLWFLLIATAFMTKPALNAKPN